ncbi:SpoIIE family protein phosphatase [Streptomyces sp. NPDC005438]|uniref:SpoIIE family protein phosphatase n=1 Tax=Streptomyces sp. NPDC005438 TaxID=3156880 RepID=UPI0033A9872A
MTLALGLLDEADPASVPGVLLDACLARVPGRNGVVYLLTDSRWLGLAAGRGYDPGALERFRRISTGAELPVARCARVRRAMFTPAEYFRVPYPDVASFFRPVAFHCLPLMVGERLVGVVLVEHPPEEPGRRLREELRLLCALGARRLDGAGGRDRAEAGDAGGAAHTAGAGDAESAPTAHVGEAGEDPAGGLWTVDGRSRSARLELAMANAELGVFDWDFDSGRLIWDERTCRLFGVEPHLFDEQVESFFRALHPEDVSDVERDLADGVDSGRFRSRYRVRRPDGTVRWVAAEGRVLHDARGRPQGVSGVVRDRTEERRREVREAARRDFVVRVTQGVTGALSTQEVIEAASAAVLPALGARTLVVLVLEGEQVEIVGSHGFTEEEQRIHVRLINRAGRRFGSARAVLVDRPHYLATREEYLRTYGEDFPPQDWEQAWAFLPLVTEEGTVGVCALGFDRPHDFGEEDRGLCESVAGVLAQALDRSRTLDQRRGQMTELQRMMLPRRVPELDGVDLVVRYLPGSEGLEVGGDWYDVVPLPDGRVLLVIGDVQGHSAQAAAVMGYLRVAMQSYAAQGPGPEELLVKGDQMLTELETERFATCAVAELSPDGGWFRLARAGHALPVLLEPDGRVRELDGPGGLPLGTFGRGPYPVVSHPLPRGATLLLYTDGLVERRGEDYGRSVEHLVRRLADWCGAHRAPGGWDLGALADHLVAGVEEDPVHDDLALLMLRRG